MKKKFLILILLLSIFIMPGVKAEENVITCSNTKNLFDNKFIKGSYTLTNNVPNDFTTDGANTNIRVVSTSFIEVLPNTTYFYSQNYSAGYMYILYFDEAFKGIGSFPGSPTTRFSFTTPNKTKYVRLMNQNNSMCSLFWPDYNSGKGWAQLELGDTQTERVAYEPCAGVDTYYSIYTSKLTLLSNFVLENKFMFAFVAIILLFVILEIILKLLNLKGGKY